MYVHINSKSHFHDLRGHCGLQMTSEVKFDLGFGISDLGRPYNRGFIVLLLVNFGTCQEKTKSLCSWAALALQLKTSTIETCCNIYPHFEFPPPLILFQVFHAGEDTQCASSASSKELNIQRAGGNLWEGSGGGGMPIHENPLPGFHPPPRINVG